MSRRLIPLTEKEWLKRAQAAKYSVEALAKQCGVSASTLARHLHAVCGQCPRAWLRGVRMAQAKHWLAEGMKVAWVAAELAYKSASTFSREFKNHFGYPPSEHAQRTLDEVNFREMTDWDMK